MQKCSLCRANIISEFSNGYKKEFRLRNSRAECGRESDIFLFARVRIPAERFYRIGEISYSIK